MRKVNGVTYPNLSNKYPIIFAFFFVCKNKKRAVIPQKNWIFVSQVFFLLVDFIDWETGRLEDLLDKIK